jgi:hypothetical protein
LSDEEDKKVYDEVIASIWGNLPTVDGSPTEAVGDLEEGYQFDFRCLISSIVSGLDLRNDVGSSEIPSEPTGGHRLHWIQKLHRADTHLDLSTDRGSGNSPPATKGRRQKGHVVLNDRQPDITDERMKVEALMAGAIFGVILAFLLRESALFRLLHALVF